MSVAVEACAGIEPDVVRRILGIELGPDADIDALPSDPEASRARASCPAQAAASGGAEDAPEITPVLLVVDEPLTAKHLERTIDVGGSPASGRSRLVALALAELLAASWIELGMRHEPEVVVVGAQGGEEARAVALQIARARLPAEREETSEAIAPPEPERPRAFGVRAFATGRVSGEPLHLSGGGGLGFDLEVLAPLAITVDARGEQGSVGVEGLGGVRLSAAWVTGLVALRLPLRLHHADFGVGARVGYGWLDGEGERGVGGAQQSGALVAVVTASHISLHVVGSAYLHIGIELGWVTLPVFGTNAITGESVARIDGGQLAITVGFEVRPD